ncbi:putative oxidoreductase [Variibacter gotjawalensis]|uniref:Putative oxidoreductase n=1 Tax=Variibacter gotjawalensis TaxID=1333996 RepID=A0A0S3PUL0_9BRAD|nr:SDR family oxidoreductase [Variibacter gotjawalensis]NIK49973.1 NADP-dependent 3-hydroxy acid dehydrogenase YdfG [Variibacter gotjawalensis]RZS45972.1 NADP-dependent 3-hydroxy acid dehydrogenase YdfG [Variibacter gotjawalensis]BAT59647.1 putative oxidoreductase [Variibacter gotjawalensis]
MTDLNGKVAWITGAGSGIGEAAAIALAKEGVSVGLTGRRAEMLQGVADKITKAGGKALVVAGDLMDSSVPEKAAKQVADKFGRLDILVNNAGANVPERRWNQLNPDRVRTVIDSNLTSTFNCAVAAMNIMRPNKSGLLIHTASWAGRFVGLLSGAAYTAAKHGAVAMSYQINMEEFQNGIRSTVLCPGEVATPILDKRPVPVSQEDRAKMIQSEDMASIIVYVAKMPPHVTLSEIVISPAWNRGYASAAGLGPKAPL